MGLGVGEPCYHKLIIIDVSGLCFILYFWSYLVIFEDVHGTSIWHPISAALWNLHGGSARWLFFDFLTCLVNIFFFFICPVNISDFFFNFCLVIISNFLICPVDDVKLLTYAVNFSDFLTYQVGFQITTGQLMQDAICTLILPHFWSMDLTRSILLNSSQKVLKW